MSTGTADAEALAAGGLEWLLGSAKPIGPGLAWTGTRDGAEIDPTLYSGAAGIVITLLEAHRHLRDDRYADAAIRGSRAIAATVDDWDHCSLYFGLTGMAVALRAAGKLLGDRAAGRAADRALGIVRLVRDLAARAIADQAGVRWANEEHRVTPSMLQPRTGWAMGNAGIIRELLRFSRATAGADPSYAVTWPDHQPAPPLACKRSGPAGPRDGRACPRQRGGRPGAGGDGS